MDFKKLNEQLEKYVINELSSELIDKVASIRLKQAKALEDKGKKAAEIARKKRFAKASADVAKCKEIRNRILNILRDKEGCSYPTLHAKLEDGFDSVQKWIYVPFESVVPWDHDEKTTYAYFGITNRPESPLYLFSKERDYHLNGGGWDFYSLTASDPYQRELPIWEDALKAVEAKFGDSEEDIKAKEKKAKRQEYNKKRWAEKKAQKLADSKPFDKFLQELRDQYGHGYIAQDVYGSTHIFKNKPTFIPTKDGYINDEEVYEPGYWTGEMIGRGDYQSKLNKAYKDQFRTDTPSNEKAIWQF